MKSNSMPAIVIKTCPESIEGESSGRGEWNTLVLEDAPRPSVNNGEVLVQVEACSVNRADLLQRRGLYPPPPGASPLLEPKPEYPQNPRPPYSDRSHGRQQNRHSARRCAD